jgi:hypothetical protein
LVWQLNKTINFNTSEFELLYGEIDKAKLKLMKLNSLKQILRLCIPGSLPTRRC